MRFGNKGKLSPRFIGPFEILRKMGDVACEKALLLDLSHVHNVFYISMLRKYMCDLAHVLKFKPLQVKENLSYE